MVLPATTTYIPVCIWMHADILGASQCSAACVRCTAIMHVAGHKCYKRAFCHSAIFVVTLLSLSMGFCGHSTPNKLQEDEEECTATIKRGYKCDKNSNWNDKKSAKKEKKWMNESASQSCFKMPQCNFPKRTMIRIFSRPTWWIFVECKLLCGFHKQFRAASACWTLILGIFFWRSFFRQFEFTLNDKPRIP